MQKYFFLIPLLLVSSMYAASRDLKHMSIGIFLGAPTGFSIGFSMNNSHVINGIVGWSFDKNPSFYLTTDYTYRWNMDMRSGQLFLYAGIGGYIKLLQDIDLGLRVPVGVSYFTPTIPLEIFFELAPGMKLIPTTSPFLNGGLGIRWRF